MANFQNSFIGLDLSASEVRAMMPDWPEAMINDYVSVLSSLRQLASQIQVMDVGVVDPNGTVAANNSRQYFNSATSKLWVNPVVGSSTGWVSVN